MKNEELKSDLFLLAQNKTVERKFVIGGAYIHYKFFDLNTPVCITFSNAGEITSHHDTLNPDYRPWGFDFVLKNNLNVLSISSYITEGWYRDKELHSFLIKLRELIRGFPCRFGYGGSMGGFGVSVFSELLNINKVLLINPISSLSPSLVEFETRFEEGKRLCWEGEFNDGGNCYAEGYVIFDPIFKLDALHAKRYKNKKLLRLPGVGHGMPMHLNKLGVLKSIFKFFIDDSLDDSWFYKKIRNRRLYENYYKWLLSSENVHLTSKRRFVIEKYYLEFKLNNTKSQNIISGKDINTIRDCALALEDVDISLAAPLMGIALKLRPEGKLIQMKYKQYKHNNK